MYELCEYTIFDIFHIGTGDFVVVPASDAGAVCAEKNAGTATGFPVGVQLHILRLVGCAVLPVDAGADALGICVRPTDGVQ